jgi:hypothetical protein
MDPADPRALEQDVVNGRVDVEAGQMGQADILDRSVRGDGVMLVRLAASEVTGRELLGQADDAQAEKASHDMARQGPSPSGAARSAVRRVVL